MKTKLFADNGLKVIEVEEHFSFDETARKYIEHILWPSGAVCPHCKNNEPTKIWKIKENKTNNIRAGLHRCADCNKEFTATVGTIVEDSHLPLHKWLLAWYLICDSKKGISSLQLQRQLKLGSYRTALFMAHRISYALKHESLAENIGTVKVPKPGCELLKCSLPFEEAIRRGLRVKPPISWKKMKPAKKHAK